MPNLETYRRYKKLTEHCLTYHTEKSTDQISVPLGALKVKKEGAIKEFNDMVQILRDMRLNSPIPPKTVVRARRSTDEGLGMLSSDLHFGKYSEVDNQVLFSWDIAATRTKRIIQNARHLWDNYMRSVHNIEDMHIFMVGDIIDGEQIYRTQAWNSEMPVIKQVTQATKILKDELLNWATKEFTNVYIHSVQGNHGEIRSSGGDSDFHWQTNFDSMLAYMLEFASADLPNVHFDIGLDRLHVAHVKKYKVDDEHRFFMMHKTPANPQSSAGRSKFGGWYQRFQVDAFITGHYHNFTYNNFNGIPILQNGGLFGSADDYTMNLAFDGYPCQVLFSIADKRPIAHLWAVDLR